MPYTKSGSVTTIQEAAHFYRQKNDHIRNAEKANFRAVPISRDKRSQQSRRRDLSRALDLSLAQQTLSDLPPYERPLTEPAECIICLETFPPSSFPEQRISSTCDHASPERRHQRACKSCLAQHLDAQLTNSGPDRLSCPICLSALTYNEIKRWASPETFSRLDSLQARTAITSDPNFIWCCNPTCGAGQLHVSGAASPIVICHACGTRTCFNHPNATWHEGFTCYEFDHPEAVEERRRQEAEETEALIRAQQEENERIREQVQGDRRLARELQEEDDRQQSPPLMADDTAAEQIRQMEQEELEQEQLEQKRLTEGEDVKSQRKEEEDKANSERTRLKERAERRKEELEGEAEVSRSSKPCPGSNCSYRITKIDGCKHMTCELISSSLDVVSRWHNRERRLLILSPKAHVAIMSGVGSAIDLGRAATSMKPAGRYRSSVPNGQYTELLVSRILLSRIRDLSSIKWQRH